MKTASLPKLVGFSCCYYLAEMLRLFVQHRHYPMISSSDYISKINKIQLVIKI